MSWEVSYIVVDYITAVKFGYSISYMLKENPQNKNKKTKQYLTIK